MNIVVYYFILHRSKSEFLNLDTTNILSQFLSWGGSLLSNTSGLYPLDVSAIPSVQQPKMSPDIAKHPYRHKVTPGQEPLVSGLLSQRL